MIPVLKTFISLADKIIPRKTELEILQSICVKDGFIRATDLQTTL